MGNPFIYFFPSFFKIEFDGCCRILSIIVHCWFSMSKLVRAIFFVFSILDSNANGFYEIVGHVTPLVKPDEQVVPVNWYTVPCYNISINSISLVKTGLFSRYWHFALAQINFARFQFRYRCVWKSTELAQIPVSVWIDQYWSIWFLRNTHNYQSTVIIVSLSQQM